MKILVNSGNIGTPVALQLAKNGHDVAIGVRSVVVNPEWDRLKLRQVAFDINDGKSMDKALSGVEAFFSLTPLVQNMVESGVNAVQAARRAGVRRIVRSSAAGAGPSAAIQLGRWHYEVEKAVEDSGIPFTILRPMNFMQNFLTYGNPESIKMQNSFYAPLGDAKLSLVDTRDVSQIAEKCLVESSHEGKRYEITGGEGLSSSEIAAVFSKFLGRKITYVDIPESAAKEAMANAGTPAWLVTMLSELNAVGKAGYLAKVSPDVEKVLGRKPTTFDAFVRDEIKFFL